jgi:LacI family transcriptional regulator
LQFLDRRSDGLIFITPINRYQTLQTLAQHRISAVVCFTDDVPESVPAVVLDDYGAMRQAVQHLTAHGHERILHLTLSLSRSDFQERWRGFEETMKAARLKPFVMSVDDAAEGDIAAGAAAALLQKIRRHHITAIACSCDKLAYWVQDIALANGLKIPHDLSLTGMDDQVESIKRGLTSIHFSSEEVGRVALEKVVQMIHGKRPPLKSVLPVKLVKRASVARPIAAK